MWNQPEGLLPSQGAHVDTFVDNADFPTLSPTGEEALMEDFRDQHRHLPRPHQHIQAPDPAALPDPPISRGSPPTTKATPKRRVDKATPKPPAKKRKTVSPPSSPTEPWTQDEQLKLRELQSDKQNRWNWKNVATKFETIRKGCPIHVGKLSSNRNSRFDLIRDGSSGKTSCSTSLLLLIVPYSVHNSPSSLLTLDSVTLPFGFSSFLSTM